MPYCSILFASAPPILYLNMKSMSAPTTEYGEAQAVYARALSREAYLCSEKQQSSGLFAVPYTYCVQVLAREDDWYRVKYAEDSGIYSAVYGYVRAEDFAVLDSKPETTFLYMPVNVTYSQPPAGGLPAIGDITVTAAFYGNFYSGGAGYSYVLYDDSFGYISGANENYPIIEVAPEPSSPSPRPSGAVVAVFVALGILAALAVALFALSGRRRRHSGER